MDIPAFLVSKTALMGAGSVGTAAVGTITVQVSIGQYSFAPNKFTGFKRSFNTDPAHPDVNLVAGDCFQNFFPSATYPTARRMSAPRSWNSAVSKPAFTVGEGSGLVGCKLVKFTRSGEANKNTPFVYKSEIAARNGTDGLVLSTVIYKASDTSNPAYKFWLLYFKKTNGVWSMDWEHKYEGKGGSQEPKLHISFPFSFAIPRINKQFSMVEASSASAPKSFHGAWIWEGSAKGDADLFYESSYQKGPNTERDWFLEKNGDAKRLYSPLNASKGIWRTSKDYCEAFKSTPPKPIDRTAENVLDICYIKNY